LKAQAWRAHFLRVDVASLLDIHSRKFGFRSLTYSELRTERLITFLWGFALALAPLVTNIIVFSLGNKKWIEYFIENIPDATLTGFTIAVVALSNSFFNSSKPLTYKQMSIGTHIAIFSIAALAFANFVIHVCTSVLNIKNSDLYIVAIGSTICIAFASWILQVIYVKDITYRSVVTRKTRSIRSTRGIRGG
jgi:hypothetical protein